MADWPATFLCSAAPRSNSSTSATAASISTRPSAPAAIRALILAAADCNVIGIDRDQRAIAAGFDLVVAGANGRLVLVEDRFSNLEGVARSCGYDAVDGVVLDVGVSSMQLDEAARGFSFRLDGPLDMRMGGAGPSAADVVQRASERDLAAIIATLGEERHARAVARAIVRARDATPIETTGALAEIVGRVVHARPGADPSGDAHLPGAAHLRERGAATSLPPRWKPPSACCGRAAGWSWCRSIRSRTASSNRS